MRKEEDQKNSADSERRHEEKQQKMLRIETSGGVTADNWLIRSIRNGDQNKNEGKLN